MSGPEKKLFSAKVKSRLTHQNPVTTSAHTRASHRKRRSCNVPIDEETGLPWIPVADSSEQSRSSQSSSNGNGTRFSGESQQQISETPQSAPAGDNSSWIRPPSKDLPTSWGGLTDAPPIRSWDQPNFQLDSPMQDIQDAVDEENTACIGGTNCVEEVDDVPIRIRGLLLSSRSHVATAIYNGSALEPLKCRSMFDANTEQLWLPSSCVATEMIKMTGLQHLHKCILKNLNAPLISAFVERWHPETNSFHLPFGEITITLHDVWYILRIPVEGEVVRFCQTPSNQLSMRVAIAKLLGLDQDNVKAHIKSGGLSCKYVRQLLDSARSDDDEAQAVGYIWWLVQSVLFPDKTTTHLHCQFLPFVQHLKEVANYAWGAATLCYLYRQLGAASRIETAQIAGCLSLLEVWIYEYFPRFRPADDPHWKSDLPHACKWMSYQRRCPSVSIRTEYRNILNNLSEDEVCWTPFSKTPSIDVPITLFIGIIHCRTMTEAYMPERVLRQFGYVQTIPLPPIAPITASRGPKPNQYSVVYEDRVRDFENHQGFLLSPKTINSRPVAYPEEASTEYLEWFLSRSIRIIGSASTIAAYNVKQGTQMPRSTRIQWIAEQLIPCHPSMCHRYSVNECIAAAKKVAVYLQEFMIIGNPEIEAWCSMQTSGRQQEKNQHDHPISRN